MPPTGLRPGQVDRLAVAGAKGIQLTGFRDERLGHLHLANDLREAAVGQVDLFVLGLLELLPAF